MAPLNSLFTSSLLRKTTVPLDMSGRSWCVTPQLLRSGLTWNGPGSWERQWWRSGAAMWRGPCTETITGQWSRSVSRRVQTMIHSWRCSTASGSHHVHHQHHHHQVMTWCMLFSVFTVCWLITLVNFDVTFCCYFFAHRYDTIMQTLTTGEPTRPKVASKSIFSLVWLWPLTSWPQKLIISGRI